MSRPDFTKLAVHRQVEAMGCTHFEVGIFDPVKDQMRNCPWTREAVMKDENIAFLKLKNMQGCQIYIRPAGTHGLTMLDDLKGSTVDAMKESGFAPALVVETSPGNFQAWIKHGKQLPVAESTAAARICAEKFGGDPGSADWRHYGRLAGFTNRKPKYQQDNGHYPFVRLREHTGQVYERATELIQQAGQVVADERAAEAARREAYKNRPPSAHQGDLRTIGSFWNDPKYGGDHTRSDLAYATYALARNVSEAEVDGALRSRDLSHKGNPARQTDYVTRTIGKAKARALEGVER